MSLKLKILVMTAVFIFLGWFLSTPVNRIGVNTSYLEAPVGEKQFDKKELNAFLDLWSRMMHSSLKDEVSQISLKKDNDCPYALKAWLKAQNWSVERFFYDEQRLRDIIKCAELKKNYDANLKLSGTRGVDLQNIISDLKEKLQLCKFAESELYLVGAYLPQIIDILEGKSEFSAE